MTIQRVSIPILATTLLLVMRPAAPSAQIITSDTFHPNAAADSNGPPAPLPALPPEPPLLLRERDLSGPRIGFTVAGGSMGREMKDHGVGQIVSQFGWHFEHQVVPLGGGPELITEVVPLVGAVEYGKVIPSVTAALGIRTESGFEFGMGPSLTLSNSAGHSAMGLVVAAGKSIDYGGISLPIDVAVSTNPNGTRTTITAGYAIRRSSH